MTLRPFTFPELQVGDMIVCTSPNLRRIEPLLVLGVTPLPQGGARIRWLRVEGTVDELSYGAAAYPFSWMRLAREGEA